MTDQVFLRISFGLASLIFEAVLLCMLLVLGHGERDNNVKFQTLVILILSGNGISILDNVFRINGLFGLPVTLQLFLQVSALVLNIFLTWYVFQYVCTYIPDYSNDRLARLNRCIVGAGLILGVGLFAYAAITTPSTATGVAVPGWGRIIIGYLVELYFLFLSMIVILHYREGFGKREFLTVQAAYVATISTIILQFFSTRGMILNYFGAVVGSYIFFIGVEIPDRRNLKKSMEVVMTLAEAIDAKDTYTKGHSRRVAEYSREIAERVGYSDAQQRDIYMTGLLHDVGKIGVPDAVINKPGKLTEEEFAEIKMHPEKGAKILESLKQMPYLITGARWHHERYDGRGYPDGLVGTGIPEEARIIAVADAYDAMTSNRSYRRGMDQAKVRQQIKEGKGTQFDPRFADVMLQMIDEDKDYHMREI